MTDLRDIAQALPGMGGVEIGVMLAHFAADVPRGQAIVEVGCWLGAGTAHLALGAGQTPIHVYDRWRAKENEVRHAASFGVSLSEGENTLPRVVETLRPFNANIRFHRGDIRKARWGGKAIGLYVDDASKAAKGWDHSAATFLPHVPVGGMAVLMDFHFRAEGRPLAQVAWMETRADQWERIADRVNGTTASVFRRIA